MVDSRRTKKWARHIHLKEGALRGWCEKCPAARRHAALRSVARHDGYAKAVRRLNFLRNVANRKDNKRLAVVAGRDLRWAQKSLRSRSA
jgi:hypothetical protein